MDIASVETLLEACENNKVAAQKGFGEKTQQNILDAVRYQQENSGKYLYAQIEDFALAVKTRLDENFDGSKTKITGAFRRQLEVLDCIEYITTIRHEDLKKLFCAPDYYIISESIEAITFIASKSIKLKFYITEEPDFAKQLFITTGSKAFVQACENLPEWQTGYSPETEHEL